MHGLPTESEDVREPAFGLIFCVVEQHQSGNSDAKVPRLVHAFDQQDETTINIC